MSRSTTPRRTTNTTAQITAFTPNTFQNSAIFQTGETGFTVFQRGKVDIAVNAARDVHVLRVFLHENEARVRDDLSLGGTHVPTPHDIMREVARRWACCANKQSYYTKHMRLEFDKIEAEWDTLTLSDRETYEEQAEDLNNHIAPASFQNSVRSSPATELFDDEEYDENKPFGDGLFLFPSAVKMRDMEEEGEGEEEEGRDDIPLPPVVKRRTTNDDDVERGKVVAPPVRRTPGVCSLQSMVPSGRYSRRFEKSRRIVANPAGKMSIVDVSEDEDADEEDKFEYPGGQDHLGQGYHGHDFGIDDFGHDNEGDFNKEDEDDEPSSELSGSDNHATDRIGNGHRVRNNVVAESSNSATRATQSLRIAAASNENRMEQAQGQNVQKQIVSTKEKVIAIGSRLVLYSICRGMCATY